MDENEYRLYKIQQRRELVREQGQRNRRYSRMARSGRAVIHKRNYICLECRKAYNYTAVHGVEDKQFPYTLIKFCPIHKTRLIRYIGHLPKKNRVQKWKEINKEQTR